MSQTASSQPAELTCRAMSAETMNIPEPIIEPATIMVESSKPRPRTNRASPGAELVSSVAGLLLLLDGLIFSSNRDLRCRVRLPDAIKKVNDQADHEPAAKSDPGLERKFHHQPAAC